MPNSDLAMAIANVGRNAGESQQCIYWPRVQRGQVDITRAAGPATPPRRSSTERARSKRRARRDPLEVRSPGCRGPSARRRDYSASLAARVQHLHRRLKPASWRCWHRHLRSVNVFSGYPGWVKRAGVQICGWLVRAYWISWRIKYLFNVFFLCSAADGGAAHDGRAGRAALKVTPAMCGVAADRMNRIIRGWACNRLRDDCDSSSDIAVQLLNQAGRLP